MSEDGTASGERALDGFGFELPLDEWLGRVRTAVGAAPLGELGSYELLGAAASGGQGVVYRARQRGTGREVALKRLVGGSFASEESRRRFAREIEAAASLHHPGIVAVFGYDEVEGQPLLVMEWVEGVPVTAWARGEGPGGERDRVPEPHEVIEMGIAICDAVQHAHRNGVLHRDLKPSNILVDARGRPRVVDFGLAKRLAGTPDGTPDGAPGGAPDGAAGPVTGSALFLGTPEYASPEHFDCGAAVDARSDVYSLGVILYEMLTGAHPRGAAEGIREHLDALAAEALRRPSHVRAALGPELDAILLRCLAYRPRDRYQSVAALAEDLGRYLRGDAVLAHPPSTWYQLKKIARRNPAAAALAVALVALLVVALGVFSRQSDVLAAERERAVREAERAGAIVSYFADDLIDELHAFRSGPDATLLETIDATLPVIGERFADRPDLESAVRASVGNVFVHVGRAEDAVAQFQRVHEIALGADGPSPRALAEAEYQVAMGLYSRGAEADDVAPLLERALAGARELDPPASTTAGGAAMVLAAIYESRAARDDLERVCRAGLAAHRAAGTLGHSTRYDLEHYLVLLLARSGRREEARERLAETLLYATREGGAEDRAAVLHSKGRFCYATGAYEEAVRTYRELIDYYEGELGPENMMLPGLLWGLTSSLHAVEGYDEALESGWRWHALVAERDDHSRASALTSIGSVLVSRGDAGEGLEHLLAARALEEELGRGGREEARNLRWLAAAYQSLGRDEEALDCGRRALEATERLFGAESDYVARVHDVLFRALCALGRPDEAEEHALRRAAWLAECPDGDSSSCSAALRAYAEWWRGRGREREAQRWRDAAGRL